MKIYLQFFISSIFAYDMISILEGFYLGLWPAILLSGPPCYTPVILPKYLEKYQVFTKGARLLYLPVKLKRVYNGGPIVIGVTPFLRSINTS